jgi:hypothetical protein
MPAFFFHYNRPASIKNGKLVVSLHFSGKCHLVDNVVCDVPTKGRSRKTQPRFVVAGKAESITIRDNIAFIR